VGGWWGDEFKRTGYDALVIHGRADSPIYLWIKDAEIEFREADHLWGELTAPTQAAIHTELDDEKVRIAQIGPAGENLVRYAAIMHDVNRAAGRNGLGAVMGSKNLKAVAVRGSQRVPVADRKRMMTVARWLSENYKKEMAWATAGIGRGTQDGVAGQAAVGGLPTHNFSEPVFENAHLLSGERNYEMFLKDRDTCHGCPVRCKQVFENEDENPSRRLDPVYGGAEYEGMAAFGSICGVDDNLAVLKANELSNAYGLDVISAGMSIGFVMECFERGLLTEEETGGEGYRWGDADLLVRSVEMIAKRQGFGDLLAEGVERMSARFGPKSAQYAVTVKGQELPMHEPRIKAALGLGYAVAPVGADHMMNMHDTAFARQGAALRRVNQAMDEPVGPLDRHVLNEDKLRIFFHELNWQHFQDCGLSCHFYAYDYQQLADVLSAVTGLEYGIHDMLSVGARAQVLARLLNLREGLTAADDRLPKRVMTAFESGPLEGIEITQEAFEWAKRRYYEMMKWNPESGEPLPECLRELDLNRLLDVM
jgi:aldehyde:ferredoxin oxidoreductase